VVERLLGKFNGFSPHIPVRQGVAQRSTSPRGDGAVRQKSMGKPSRDRMTGSLDRRRSLSLPREDLAGTTILAHRNRDEHILADGRTTEI
jgi:hypothetical protein